MALRQGNLGTKPGALGSLQQGIKKVKSPKLAGIGWGHQLFWDAQSGVGKTHRHGQGGLRFFDAGLTVRGAHAAATTMYFILVSHNRILFRFWLGERESETLGKCRTHMPFQDLEGCPL